MYLTKLSLILFLSSLVICQDFFTDMEMHLGCFYDQPSNRDLPLLASISSVTVKTCTASCYSHFYKYSGLQGGSKCYCGGSYGKHGPGQCNIKCRSSQNETCGGSSSNSVYSTGFKGNLSSISKYFVGLPSQTLTLYEFQQIKVFRSISAGSTKIR